MNRILQTGILLSLLAASCALQPLASPADQAPAAPTQSGDARDDRQILKVGVSAISANVSPQAIAFPYLGWPLYDNLIQFGPKYELNPSLAEKCELSADRLTWTFIIRKDVTFSNGQPLAAQDIKFSLATAKKDTWSGVSPLVRTVIGRAVDKCTFTMTTSQPDVSVPTVRRDQRS